MTGRVGIGDNSRLICEDLGSVAGLYEVAGQSGYSLNVFNLEQIMDAPSDDDIRTLVESSRDETLNDVARVLWSIMNLRFPFRGLANDLTCLRLNCCHVSWVSRLGVLLLSLLPKFRSSMMLLLSLSSQSAPPSSRVLDVEFFCMVAERV